MEFLHGFVVCDARRAARIARVAAVSFLLASGVVFGALPPCPECAVPPGWESLYESTGGEVADGVIVDFRDDVPLSMAESLSRRLGLRIVQGTEWTRRSRICLFTGGGGWRRLWRSLLSYLGAGVVERMEPDYYVFALRDPAAASPNDPLYKYQWHMRMIDVEHAWNFSMGAGVVVAVIDTGVAYAAVGHRRRLEDLENTRFVEGVNFVDRSFPPLDDHGHGSHVAGTIAQSTNNGKGVVGVAPAAAVMPVKVLDARGRGTVFDIALGIRYAADHGARVINMSLGGPFPSTVMRLACRYAAAKGVTIVCAAGNSGKRGVSYPAAYEECIAVAALDSRGRRAFYSSYGPQVELCAPGGDTREDYNGDGVKDGVLQNTIFRGNPSKEGYFTYMGTSMAAPHVAGAAALLISAGVDSPADVRRLLRVTARMPEGREPPDEQYGYGLIQPAVALERVRERERTGPLHILLLLILVALVLWRLLRRKVDWTLLVLGVMIVVLLLLLDAWSCAFHAPAGVDLLWWSFLPPLLAIGLFYGMEILRPLLLGLAWYWAVSGFCEAWWGWGDLVCLPGLLADHVWMFFNSAAAFLLGLLVPLSSARRDS